MKLRFAPHESAVPLICAWPVVAAVKVTSPPRVRVPVPALTTLVKPATGVMPRVPMVRLPPPAVLMMGVGFVVVAPVDTIATLPMVSVAPLKSRMPRPLRVTTPVPIMSGFVVEAAYCTVAAVLSAPPTVRPPAGIAWTPLTPFTLANASVPALTVVRPS